MKLEGFQVTHYRNIVDSGWIKTNQITAFVGQNEAGKSNLFEAIYRVNPIIKSEAYNINEDWPVDNWENQVDAPKTTVCTADFSLSQDEINDLFSFAMPQTAQKSPAATEETPSLGNLQPPAVNPTEVTIRGARKYESATTFTLSGAGTDRLETNQVQQWIENNVPKFVYIQDYMLSGNHVELPQLRERLNEKGQKRHLLSKEDQTILIVLDLAKIQIDDFISKGTSAEGRTVRTYDKKSASSYLTSQFQKLWRQKEVNFDIEIDGPTLNIFATDVAIGMPVRLHKRSTGFRWYVSFAWNFTHASHGQYKNCILLLEEPGIHLHYDGQRDLLGVFERLSSDNTILYSTHLASMVDLGHPERIRIVETRLNHAHVIHGIVSSQRGPMAVIEMSLGLTGDMSGLLGNRQSLIVEGGDDALILQKLSAMLRSEGHESLSDRIYPWPARGASKAIMYAAFAIGHKWDSAVLFDTDSAGQNAKQRINELYLSKLASADKGRFRVLMLGQAAGINKTDASIEDLFPDEFYLELVNEAYGLSIKLEDLPLDGSDMITKRTEAVLKSKYGKPEIDKRKVFETMLKRFDAWNKVSDLPKGTLEKAIKLFKTINQSFK